MNSEELTKLENDIRSLKGLYLRKPREIFVKTAKSRLVNRIVLAQAQKQSRVRQFLIPQFVAASLIAIIVFGITIGLVIASEKALPGQPIYALKRVKESLIIASTFDPSKKARLQIEYAIERAEELFEISESGDQLKIIDTSKELKQHINQSQKETERIPDQIKPQFKDEIEPKLDKTQQILEQVQNKVESPAKEAVKDAINSVKQNRLQSKSEDDDDDNDDKVKGTKQEKVINQDKKNEGKGKKKKENEDEKDKDDDDNKKDEEDQED